MIYRDCFSSYHPLINFLYFLLVVLFAMFFMHPAALVISLASAIAYSVRLNGRKAVRFNLIYMLPLLLITALLNPIFNHTGLTIITYLPSGNPLTVESIIYGVAAAMMLVAVISWFICYTAVMTSEKFVYLFGRIIPALSLILSMSLRLAPRFKQQISTVNTAQRSLGRDLSSGSLWQRAKNAVTILSITITWALENAVETADSMRSRGYGRPGRTAFSIYRFDKRDLLALLWLLISAIYIISGWAGGALQWSYFPSLQGAEMGLYQITVLAMYLALCLTPLLLNIREDSKWTRLPSTT